MENLPNWKIDSMKPAFYDDESKTVIEQMAHVYKVMQDMIKLWNKFEETISTSMEVSKEDFEYFKKELTRMMNDHYQYLDSAIGRQDLTIEESITNVNNVVNEVVNDKIATGKIFLVEEYDPEKESMVFRVGGSV